MSVRSARTPSTPAMRREELVAGRRQLVRPDIGVGRGAKRVEPLIGDAARDEDPRAIAIGRASPAGGSRDAAGPGGARRSARIRSSASRQVLARVGVARCACGRARPRRTPSRRATHTPASCSSRSASSARRSGRCRRCRGRRRTRRPACGSGCRGSRSGPSTMRSRRARNSRDHRVDVVLRPGQRLDRGDLGERRRARLIVLMIELAVRLRRATAARSRSPAASRSSRRSWRSRRATIVRSAMPGSERDRHVLLAVVQDAAVDLVREHDEVVAATRQLGDRARCRRGSARRRSGSPAS